MGDIISDGGYWWYLTHPGREMPEDEKVHFGLVQKEQVLSGDIEMVSNVKYLGLRLKHYVLILVASVMGCVLIGVFVRYYKEMREQIEMRKTFDGTSSIGMEYGT